MRGEKISETFRAAIVLTEVLNRLSVKTEMLGFNSRLHEFQPFGKQMSKEVRTKMGTMPDSVFSPAANATDTGWAVERASERLSKQKASEKFLFVLSDGLPEESPAHPRSNYDLTAIVRQVIEHTDQKLVGLGIGPGTGPVVEYFPNAIANVGVDEMAEKLGDLIREAIANYDSFA
jgi:cobalamin biosynthesis protein CobT